jgi:hypothetical protein
MGNESFLKKYYEKCFGKKNPHGWWGNYNTKKE